MNSKHPMTPDGRYFVVRGRLWRLANPDLASVHKDELVSELMTARRAVKQAKADDDVAAEATAHQAVDQQSGRWVSAGRSGGRTGRRISTGTW